MIIYLETIRNIDNSLFKLRKHFLHYTKLSVIFGEDCNDDHHHGHHDDKKDIKNYNNNKKLSKQK